MRKKLAALGVFATLLAYLSFAKAPTLGRGIKRGEANLLSPKGENTEGSQPSVVYCPSCNPHANTDVTITANATEHTVVMPYERSFRFIATIKNDGSTTQEIYTSYDRDAVPDHWHLLAPTGRYKLAPGQSANYIAVFEPEAGSSKQQEEVATIPISFSWNGESKKFDVTVRTKMLSSANLKTDDLSEVKIYLSDRSTTEAISGATVSAMLPSGIGQFKTTEGEGGYTFSIPSGTYLENITEEYQIDHTSTGYYLQISARGYKSYFESNYLPAFGNIKSIKLEPLNEVGEYSLQKTVESGYSIWWIRASADEKYFAFSQGAHGMQGQEPSDQTKVLLTDDSGNVIWERQTGGECWGADISPNGEYVAVGCHDSKIYVWDKDGSEVWTYSNAGDDPASPGGGRVRWVKFSPDNRYLLAGYVNKTPEKSGLFEVETGNLLWSFYTGDWLREGRFSSDSQTTYFSSANGTVYALETDTGNFKWLGTGDHVIPFMLGVSEQSGAIVSAGKGRAFTALNLSDGTPAWQTVIDQTVTAAQIAEDGTMVGSTVGGMSYGLDADGSLRWMRNYGGVGHNGVHYTKNSNFALLGGPNPTLFDANGNVLWQREKDKEIEMTGPVEQDTGGANAVWISEDSSLIILGLDSGDISFYKGAVNEGTNDYSQLTGPNISEGTFGRDGGTANLPIPVWALWSLVGLLGVGLIIGAIKFTRRP